MEVIGAAASGIALGQLCIGIAKALHLWHSIEDLPSDLQDAVERLEALNPVLQDIIQKLSSYEEEYEESGPKLPAQHVKACAVYAAKAHKAVDEMLAEDTEAELAESDEEKDEACMGGVEA
ncbi:ankyrin repeat-containing protein [Colletotrichum tofieldiae]|nr:ankyrin repeat-containing protein [Colletotrichum tofieldiae]GKT74860.1 ankyrin repeat-containing protein [Colletotrichum tofieldiae]GKT92059.1 ankyrin repeat-containing protein [Colletotrichum tofieldiae]